MDDRAHAIVLGAGIAGLCTAAVLAKHFAHVTLVERDQISQLASGEGRRGIPQSPHVNLLTMRAVRQLEVLFPLWTRQCLDDGAIAAEAGSQFRVKFHGSVLMQNPAGTDVLLASRPFLEEKIRARVLRLPTVTLREDTQVAGLLAGDDGNGSTEVRGVRLLGSRPGADPVEADLVVDATGRGARSGAWLEQLGYRRPPEQTVRADVTYLSRHFALPPDALGSDRAVVVGATAALPRGMTFLAQENGRWVLSLQSYGRQPAPADPESFLAFVASVAPGDVMDHLRNAQPLDPIAVHHYPRGVRHRYDQLHRFPRGLLVIGDAQCSINPVYGSGMAMAVAQAAVLDSHLGQGTGPLAREFFSAARQETSLPWWLAALGDYATVRGNRRARLLGSCFRRVMAAAAHDPITSAAVIKMIGLGDSPLHLARPHILHQVLTTSTRLSDQR